MSFSLCVLRIEVDEDLPDMGDKPAEIEAAKEQKKRDRGSRESSTITVETYASVVSGPNSVPGVLPTSSRQSPPEGCEKEETISFFCGNPLIEVTKGVLHLYKENELRDTDEAKTLCLLSVPGALGAPDLLAFAAACQQDIGHVRILRDGSPDHYMALFTFRSAAAAREFHAAFDGVPYSSLEPGGVCHMAWVSRVESARDGAAPPTHTELPTCPVCLERMEESVAGVVSVQCAHAFHAACLARWRDARCPVCRCVCTPEPSHNTCQHCELTEEEGGDGEESRLNMSGVGEGLGGVEGGSLWICLICGHVGCGRYERGHAAKHFLASNHTYALQLGSNRVWDYAGDNFVHRLVQNKPDGKLVAAGGHSDDPCSEDKMDAAQLEFTYILTQQMDAQRTYFTEKIAKLESAHKAESSQLLDLNEDLQQQVAALGKENTGLQKKLSDEKKNLEKKLSSVTAKVSVLAAQLSEERSLAAALAAAHHEWRNTQDAREAQLQQQVSELKEQLRDVLFFVEARDKLQAAAGASQQEIQDASVTVSGSNSSGRKSRKKR